MDEPREKDSLTPDGVDAINNLDTARMSLRWALERIRSLERRIEPLLSDLNEYKLKVQQEQRNRLEFKERLSASEDNARWLAEMLERERSRRRQSEQNSQRFEDELEPLTERCAALESQLRESAQQNKKKQAELEELRQSLARERAAAAQELDDRRRGESQQIPRQLEFERRLRASEEEARRAAEALARETGLRQELEASVRRLLREDQRKQAELDSLNAGSGAQIHGRKPQEKAAQAGPELAAAARQSLRKQSDLEADIAGLQREKKSLQEELGRLLREGRENAGMAAQSLAELERQLQEGRSRQVELEILANSLQREKAALSAELEAWKRKALEGVPGAGSEAEARFAALQEEMKRREATLIAQKRQAEEMGDFLAQEYERKRAEVERLKADFLKGMAKAMERYGEDAR